MKLRWKYGLLIILLPLAVGVGWYYGSRFNPFATEESVDATVMLERVQNVHKLVLIEGAFSEIYDYKDYWMYDLYPFRRKALVRINAKVLVGFDLEKASIELDDATRTIYINHLPPSEILAIDHDMDYYDLQEGTFNQFDEAKLTDIGKSAKAFIRTQAQKSDLMTRAEKRKSIFLKELEWIANTHGWKISVENDVTEDLLD